MFEQIIEDIIENSWLLLAPQSGAHRRGGYRDVHPFHPLLSLYILKHLSLYIQKHLSLYMWKHFSLYIQKHLSLYVQERLNR